jgi:hypothetical protein
MNKVKSQMSPNVDMTNKISITDVKNSLIALDATRL